MKGADSNETPVTAMPSAPPSYNEAIAHSEVQGNPPAPGFYPPPYAGNPPPPQPGYAYPQPQPYMAQPNPTFISVVQGPGVSRTEVVFTSLGAGPARVKCPNCSADIITSTTTGPSCLAHLCCLAMFLTGFWLCSCLPYCISSFESTTHHCPNCKVVIGSYREGC